MAKSVIKENMLQILSHPDIILESSQSEKIRGSNFSHGKVLLLIDTNQRSWLWKKLTVNDILKEYIISYISKNIGIPIPESMLVMNNNTPGLLQEWISDGKELANLNDISKSISNKEILFLLLAFEAWIGAFDRHGANYITRNEHIWAIDFENSFSNQIYGSELCVYFPWIKEYPEKVRKAATKLRVMILQKGLLEKKTIQKITSDLSLIVNDKRAKKALENKIEEMFAFLVNNLVILENLSSNYLEKSYSIPDLLIVK